MAACIMKFFLNGRCDVCRHVNFLEIFGSIASHLWVCSTCAAKRDAYLNKRALAVITGEPDFTCCKCCTKTDTAPDPPGWTYCEYCCPDHEYEYDKWEQAKICTVCGKRKPDDWDEP